MQLGANYASHSGLWTGVKGWFSGLQHVQFLIALGLLRAVPILRAQSNYLDTLPPTYVVGTNSFSEALQNTPITATEFAGAQLAEAQIDSLLKLPQAVPNFSQSHTGLRSFADNYVIRGLGNTDFLSDPAVVVYLDDAPFGDGISYTPDLLSVDDLEVYRGPQGSRFGKNAEAGVINIISRQPKDQFEVQANVSGATFDAQEYRIQAEGPVVKGALYFALAGQYSASDGYIRNGFLHTDADKSEGMNGRGSLKWIPAEHWDLTFNATVDRFNDGIGLVPVSGDSRHTMSDFDGKYDGMANSQSLRIKGVLPGTTVTSITT